MAANNKTYQPVQLITVKAVEDLPAFRFVSHLGSLCADASRSLGVTDTNWVTDEYAAVVTLGTIPVETTTTINAGSDITSAIDGKAKPAGQSEPVNGRAIESCSAGDFVKIKIVP